LKQLYLDNVKSVSDKPDEWCFDCLIVRCTQVLNQILHVHENQSIPLKTAITT
jgi:hypothetical protein